MEKVNQIWNNTYEQYIIKTFRQTHSVIKMKSLFLAKFPEHADLWTYDSLRLRFFKIIRKGYQELKDIITNRTYDNLP